MSNIKYEPASFSPREIVSELDRHIIGQKEAKKAVAVALRNRWRRMQLPEDIREEIIPKNILMIGPTGVGKTEIARRLAKLANAPFIKVEATKFTEVGYVGRDVDQIIRDLMDVAVGMTREQMRKAVRVKAEDKAEERILKALVGDSAADTTRDTFRKQLRTGELDDREIDIEVNNTDTGGMPMFDIPGMPGASMGMINVGEMMGKAFGQRTKTRSMKIKDAQKLIVDEEADKLLDEDKIVENAKHLVENNGIVFIDEIDKIASRSDVRGGDVSREGVQRDLLPLIEGTTVSTKYGMVRTDFILFVASGAFHYAKPSDLLAELQGRLPIRVELNALSEEDFKSILLEPDHSLIKQSIALMGTENVTLKFTDDAIDALAKLAFDINKTVENIGARRLHTVLENLLEEISYAAPDRGGETVEINAEFVRTKLDKFVQDADLSRFIL